MSNWQKFATGMMAGGKLILALTVIWTILGVLFPNGLMAGDEQSVTPVSTYLLNALPLIIVGAVYIVGKVLYKRQKYTAASVILLFEIVGVLGYLVYLSLNLPS